MCIRDRYDQDVNAGVGEGKTYEIRKMCIRDRDASIDAMNAAMDSAGIQDILDEMNRQAAEYVAEKEVK